MFDNPPSPPHPLPCPFYMKVIPGGGWGGGGKLRAYDYYSLFTVVPERVNATSD